MIPTPLFASANLPSGPLVVAVSGGLDSMVLLHHLRFLSGRPEDLRVAHLDHAMRPGSREDADWLAGVCLAWGLSLSRSRLRRPPSSEAEARSRRLSFLERARREAGASVVVTAHHADDQAETVLFRLLRGTGVAGLAGMARGSGPVVRPLLGRWRRELQAYAEHHRVPHRRDATNADLSFARNALRHVVIPAAEERVAPGSRRALLRLAQNAARHREEMRELEAWVFGDAVEETSAGRVEVGAETLEALPPPLRRRLLRWAAERAGVTLSSQATDQAVAAVEGLQVGRGLDLTGGLRLERSRARWILLRPDSARAREGRRHPPESGRDSPHVVIPGPEGGTRRLDLGPVSWRVDWSPEPFPGGTGLLLPPSRSYPLTIRGWAAGDRIRLRYGSKSVARLLSERGVPALDRPVAPIAVDRAGRIVWIPGVAVAERFTEGSDPGSGGERTYIACTRVEGDGPA